MKRLSIFKKNRDQTFNNKNFKKKYNKIKMNKVKNNPIQIMKKFKWQC